MRKNLLKSLLAVAAFCLGGMTVSAQNQEATAPVKMTFIDQSFPDSINGLCDTIKVGYNKAPSVDGTIGFGNTSWGCNWIGVLKVDVSAIPGTVQKATLKAKISGSTDSKRTTGWGVALTDNAWSDKLNYTTAGAWTVSALLNGGTQVWTSTKSAVTFEEHEWDITEALSAGQTAATILVYETAAAGGYMTEAYAEIEYEPFEATTTKYDFEDGNKVFTDDSRITSAIEANEDLASNVLGWTCAHNAQNGYSFSHYDFTSLLNQPALVGVEFDYYNTKGGRAILNIGDALVRGTTGGHSGKLFQNGQNYNFTGTIFRIGSDKDNAYIQGLTLKQVDVTEEQDVLDEEGNPTGEKQTVVTAVGICDKWLHVKLMVNNDAKTVAWTVTDQEGNVLYSGNDAFYSADANECTQVDLIAGLNDNHSAMLDNLTITNYKSNAVFADYTIKYVDSEGNEIKESRTGNGQVGKYVKLLDSDKTPVYNEDNTKKYIYDSDDSETVAIAEENTVITVTFRDAEVYAGVLNCMIAGQSGSAARLASFSGFTFFEGDTYDVRPSIGYGKDGQYYFTTPDSYNGRVFKFPGSLNSRTVNGVVTYIGQEDYTLDESVAYYSDIERLALPIEDAGYGTGLGQLVGEVAADNGKGPQEPWYSFSGGYFDRFSGGRGVRLAVDSYVYTEPIAEDGTYMVRIYGRNDKSAACENPYALGMRDAEGNVTIFDIVTPTWGSAATGESVVGNAAAEATEDAEAKEAAGVGLLAGTSLVIMNAGNGTNISLDDVKLTKVADYAATPTSVKGIQVVNQTTGIIYNLAGQAVKNATKGIFIINGKKVIK